MPSERDIHAAIAVTRFGLGARPGDIAAARRDPQGYLRAQVRPQGADLFQTNGAGTVQRLLEFRQFDQDRRSSRQTPTRRTPSGAPAGTANDDGSGMEAGMGGSALGAAMQSVPDERDPVRIAGRMIRRNAGGDFVGRMQLAASTPDSFRERWALFWCNHFTVTAGKLVTAVLCGPYENEAIRPAVFGTFETLLMNATFHPGMLLYLDQAQSVGPNSPAAGYVRRRLGGGGLNENLAREILELHSVSLAAGYSQADVTEFARALTGWSVGGVREGERQGRVLFRPLVHEPGARTVMGQTYPDVGGEQAVAVLRDLARSPFTARHIATKLARHFVADEPPPALVTRLEQSFISTGGRLDRLAETLIAAPEAWDPQPRKFKTPYEFLVSSWRAAGSRPQNLQQLGAILRGMGQQPFSAPSPRGWPDEATHWAPPDAIVRRMTWADRFSAAAIGSRDPMALARETLGARLNDNTATAIGRAESRSQGMAILLMSPEFQRR